MKQNIKQSWLVVAVVLSLMLLGLGARGAWAAPDSVITVNSTDDTYIPGDGKCTLREAINNANNDSNVAPNSSPDCAAGNGADTIVLTGLTDYPLTNIDSGSAPSTNGLPVITSDITINGNNSTVDRSSGAPNFRIFYVNSTGKLTLNDLAVTGGALLSNGGGIYNEGTLALNNTEIDNNQTLDATVSNGAGYGGGIYNLGHLTVNGGYVYGNKTGNGAVQYFNGGQNGGPGGDGGGIYNALGAMLDIENATISTNQTGDGYLSYEEDHNFFAPGYAGAGAGVYSEGSLTINKGYISINQSGSDTCDCISEGAGIAVKDGEFVIKDTWITANRAEFGGGLYVEKGGGSVFRSLFYTNNGFDGSAVYVAGDPSPAGSVNLINSTVANNAADWRLSPNDSRSILYSRGSLALNYVTIGDNSVPVRDQSAALVKRDSTGVLALANVIVNGTSGAPDCYQAPGASIQNQGGDIEGGSSCDFNGANGGISNGDIKLAALANNGGYTFTMALGAGSEAIDFGNKDDCNNLFIANNLDQRGYARIEGTNTECDSGAFEYGAHDITPTPTATATATATVTVTATATATRTATATNTATATATTTATVTLTPTSDPCALAPLPPTLVTPANGATVKQVRVQLKWMASPCATTYNVTVKNKGTIVDSATGLTKTKYKTMVLTKGTTYSWFVQACNTYGCTPSATFKFKLK